MRDSYIIEQLGNVNADEAGLGGLWVGGVVVAQLATVACQTPSVRVKYDLSRSTIENLPACPHGAPHGGLASCACPRGAGARTNCMPGTDMRGRDVISFDRVQQTSSKEQCQEICQKNPR